MFSGPVGAREGGSGPQSAGERLRSAPMALSEHDSKFLEANHAAAMITVAKDGTPKVARVGVALIDGKIWSSGTRDRARTKRLRRDPRCTLYVHDNEFAWLALESNVTILDGDDAPQ